MDGVNGMIAEFLKKLSPFWVGQSAKLLFKGLGPIPDHERLAARDEQIIQVICRRKARGNISLQEGRFITASELEKRRLENIGYSFMK